VQCAIESLVELGYQATTIAEVARRSGVSKSVVLYHFSSRAELMEAVVVQVYADATPPLRARRAAAPNERERVLTYVRGALSWAWSHQTEARAAREVARNLRRDDGTPWFKTGDADPLIAVAQDLLETAQRAGELGDFDPWTLAVFLRAGIDGLAEQFMADPSIDGPAVTEHFVRLVDRMIAPPSGKATRSRRTSKGES
jgi:TetR/AcrR family fatty acid metabolism transcriptional regulator